MTISRRAFLTTCSGLTAFSAAPCAAEPPQAETQRLIERLGSRKFAEREAAAAALKKLRVAALPALRKAARHHADPTVQHRAAALVKAIEAPRILTGHSKEVWALAFTPDGRFLVSGGHDRSIRVWDLRTGKTTFVLEQRGGATALAFAPDGKLLAALGRRLQLWDFANRRVHFDLGSPGHPTRVTFSPDGALLAAGGRGYTADLWTVRTGTRQRTLRGHTEQVVSVAFTPEGKHLATGSGDGTIKIWDVASGREQAALRTPGYVASLVFSSNGRALYSGGGNGNITRWNWATGHIQWDVDIPDTVWSIALRRGDGVLASATRDRFELWDARTGKKQAKVHYSSGALAVAFSPDGKLLVGAGGEEPYRPLPNDVAIWDTEILLTQSGN